MSTASDTNSMLQQIKEINTIEAGNELDKRIARILGLNIKEIPEQFGERIITMIYAYPSTIDIDTFPKNHRSDFWLKPYSTSLYHALPLFDLLPVTTKETDDDENAEIFWYIHRKKDKDTDEPQYTVSYCLYDEPEYYYSTPFSSLPLALCRAFLTAKEYGL